MFPRDWCWIWRPWHGKWTAGPPARICCPQPGGEADAVKILSGLFEGRTCGTPLCGVIENTDTRSRDYQNDLPRPGHADYAAHIRYNGCNDYRGGGHFSGRLTAPLVFAGAVAKQILAQRGIYVGAHIRQIGPVEDERFDPVHTDPALFQTLAEKTFPTLSDLAGERMRKEIYDARERMDSVGGAIECAVVGMPAGLGSPDFGCNVEGILSQHLFAVPAVKAVEFGAGFGFAAMYGSQANDPLTMAGDRVETTTNHTGGINGGITNGMPIVLFRGIAAHGVHLPASADHFSVPAGERGAGGPWPPRPLCGPSGRAGH